MFNLDQAHLDNPWWSTPARSENSSGMSSGPASRFAQVPAPLTLIDLEGGAVMSLRGPAGVGKSSLVRRLISERAQAGLARRTALLRGETLAGEGDLEAAIDAILRLYPDEEGRWIFFVDEVTHLPDWAKTVASLREYNGRFRLSSLLAVSSTTADLDRSAALLGPWRGRIVVPDRWLGPATFRQFLAARDPDRLLPPTLTIAELLSPEGRAQVERMVPRARRLDEFVLEYARSGGLPRRMSEQIDLGAPSLESATDLTDRLTDALRGPRRRKVDLAHFLGQATTDLGAMVRWADLAAALGLVKTSVSKYVKALTDAGALLVIHQHDPIRGGAPSLTRPRKVYLGDTGYAAIATDRPSVTADQTDQTEPTTGQPGQTANLSGLVENLLALALFRAFEPTMMGHFDGSQAIFTWKSVNGREVDFVVDERRPTPIQSVYGTRTRAKDYESLTKAFGRGIMASRLVTDTERPVMTIPAGVLLALLDDPSTRTDAPR